MIFLQSSPHPALQDYIGQYIYVSFNSNELPSLKQTFLPYDIPAILFFFGPVSIARPGKNSNGIITTPSQKASASFYAGLITEPFRLYFEANQEIKAFMVAFTSSGFATFFRRDIAELTNEVPDFSLIAGATEAGLFLEQLAETKSFTSQIEISNAFFLKRMSSPQSNVEQINEACRRLILANGLINMKDLACHTNMSLRTLERRFTEQVGVSPKLFARFKRLQRALSLMNLQKPPSWTDITYECGYYDQAHFIKEFRTFANHSPSAYSPHEYLLYNQLILHRNFPSF